METIGVAVAEGARGVVQKSPNVHAKAFTRHHGAALAFALEGGRSARLKVSKSLQLYSQ
jgi:hypothetical protein